MAARAGAAPAAPGPRGRAQRAGPAGARASPEQRRAGRPAGAAPSSSRPPPGPPRPSNQRDWRPITRTRTRRPALWRLGWIAWFRGRCPRRRSDGRASGRAPASALRESATTGPAGPERRGDRGRAARHWRALAAEIAAELLRHPRRQARARPAGRRRGRHAARSGQGRARLERGGLRVSGVPGEALQGDPRFDRAVALRVVGLRDCADERAGRAGAPLRRRAPRLYAALRRVRRTSGTTSRCASCGGVFLAPRAAAGRRPRQFWEMFYPLGWRDELTAAAGRAWSIRSWSRRWCARSRPTTRCARSRVGARGLMQLMPDTARPLAQPRAELPFRDGELLDDPGANLEIGTIYLRRARARVRRAAAGRRRVQRRAQARARMVGGPEVRRPRGLGRADPLQRDARVRQARHAVVGRSTGACTASHEQCLMARARPLLRRLAAGRGARRARSASIAWSLAADVAARRWASCVSLTPAPRGARPVCILVRGVAGCSAWAPRVYLHRAGGRLRPDGRADGCWASRSCAGTAPPRATGGRCCGRGRRALPAPLGLGRIFVLFTPPARAVRLRGRDPAAPPLTLPSPRGERRY